MSDHFDSLLMDRLRLAAREGPDPSQVTRKVLQGGGSRSHASGHIGRRLIGAFALMVVASIVGGYFAPVAVDGVLAGAPLSAGFIDRIGLNGIRDKVVTMDDLSSVGGVELRLTAGYADAGRTMLLLEVHSPSALALSTAMLADQFGREYRSIAVIGDLDTGNAAIFFSSLAAPADRLGARFVLTVESLSDTATQSRRVNGPWRLQGTLIPHHGIGLQTPQPGSVDGHRFQFSHLEAVPGALIASLLLPDTSLSDLTMRVGDGSPKGAPSLQLVLIHGADTIYPFTQQSSTRAGSTTIDAVWLVGPGDYVMELRGRSSRTDRPISVPRV